MKWRYRWAAGSTTVYRYSGGCDDLLQATLNSRRGSDRGGAVEDVASDVETLTKVVAAIMSALPAEALQRVVDSDAFPFEVKL